MSFRAQIDRMAKASADRRHEGWGVEIELTGPDQGDTATVSGCFGAIENNREIRDTGGYGSVQDSLVRVRLSELKAKGIDSDCDFEGWLVSRVGGGFKSREHFRVSSDRLNVRDAEIVLNLVSTSGG